MDYTLLFIVLFLLAFGLLMVYSTSYYEANLEIGDSAYYLKKQLFATILGLVAMIFVANVPYHFWERFAVIGYIVSVVLILLIIPFGHEANGAKRWLYIGPISLQPAEVSKLCMILFLASMICTMGKQIRGRKGFWMVDGDFLDTETFMAGGEKERSGGEPMEMLEDKLRTYVS
ncbi:MAG: FtsW/RodA/SpoVE family cell cycle protein, partial [Lachnospiraceae bacterium]|nr:FtsW/RodA/SpoVE family cell cycle protein [Lachnospiraceae bacterium]